MNDLQTQSLAVEPWWSGHLFPLVASAEALRLPSEACALLPRTPSPVTHLPRPVPMLFVVIGTNSPLLMCGLQSLVSEMAGVRLAGTAGSLDELLACCTRIREGVALVDPLLGGQSIRVFMETLKAGAPRMRAVLIMDGSQPHRVREAITGGACGFVGKTSDAQEIRSALSAAAEGRRYISAVSAAHLADALAQEDLTLREMQVLALLAQGHCNKDIARSLDVSLGTVKTHVRSIMSKLGARSRTEAVHKAYRLGLVCLDA
jgi:DNA-binding NarL/FixJ family response regulator